MKNHYKHLIKLPLGKYLFVGGLRMSRDSIVIIATGYGLDDQEVRVRVLVGSRIFSSPPCSDRHYSVCREFGIEVPDNWHSHVPKPVCKHEDISVLWNHGAQTDGEVLAKGPDIVNQK
jgi:hypothetical protein